MAFHLVDKRVVYNGKRVKLELHRLVDEATEKKAEREVVVHPGAVVILPVLGKAGQDILLIKNKRYAVRETLLELPAGTLEANEAPINCAGRELLEETGYLAGKLKPIGIYYTSPGVLTEKMYAFAAFDMEKREQSLDEGEEIEVVAVTLERAIHMIGAGQIVDGKTIATILMYDRFYRGK